MKVKMKIVAKASKQWRAYNYAGGAIFPYAGAVEILANPYQSNRKAKN